MDFLRAGGGGAVPAAAKGAGYAAAVSMLGISLGAGIICFGGVGADDEYLVAAARAVFDWVVVNGRGVAVLPVLGEAGRKRCNRGHLKVATTRGLESGSAGDGGAVPRA